MKKRKNHGIKEIARLAGVSIGTVDRALHNRGRVSSKTKRMVEDIVRQIDYKPNLMARSLVINRKYTIALLIPQPLHDEYWIQAFKGAKGSISKYEQQGLYFETFFYALSNKKSFEESALRILNSDPDGVIMAPNFLQEGKSFYEKCREASIPVIMFDTIIPDTHPLCYIGIDSFQSGRVAAELLTMTADKNGKFAILHFDEEQVNSPHMLEKERGFLSYLNEYCPGREYLVSVLNNKQHHYHDQLRRILRNEHISGIFVSTSKTYRIGLYLQKEQIKDTVLIGYDLTNRNTALLESGYIRFLINQNPMRQAEESLNVFFNYLFFKVIYKSRLLFPIEIITRSNLVSYI